ncbi:hypothetical protein ARMSODRAFT_611458 [Armillaria solidipes]|uniref:Mid2 domain-containing protein n=1 Tax=Armillaria solidipes TaxID=1076256 RepID=A0A2H3ATU7_9AGAR|nr:hypothetical protein ARMSODRAFT_611458 [Armillaria solidipes]
MNRWLLSAWIFLSISLASSLNITVHKLRPRINESTPVVLTWFTNDPERFSLDVRTTTLGGSLVSSLQAIENFTETCRISVVFNVTGVTYIEAVRLDTAEAIQAQNSPFCQSNQFRVLAVESLQSNSSLKNSTSETDSANSTTSHTNSRPAIIVGSTIGSLAFVGIVVSLFVLLRRRKLRRHQAHTNDAQDDGFTGPILDGSTTTIMSPYPESYRSNVESLGRISRSSVNAHEEETEQERVEVRVPAQESRRESVAGLMETASHGSRPPSYRTTRSSRRADDRVPFSPPLIPSRTIDC